MPIESKPAPLLVIPLVVIVALQVALLAYLFASWTEAMDATVSWNLAMYPAIMIGAPCDSEQGQKDAWSRFLLAVTFIAALCGLALYTHAEVQEAVVLFEALLAQLPAETAAAATGAPQPAAATAGAP
jgi:hypothetical protein